jgi:hypothetical protein
MNLAERVPQVLPAESVQRVPREFCAVHVPRRPADCSAEASSTQHYSSTGDFPVSLLTAAGVALLYLFVLGFIENFSWNGWSSVDSQLNCLNLLLQDNHDQIQPQLAVEAAAFLISHCLALKRLF